MIVPVEEMNFEIETCCEKYNQFLKYPLKKTSLEPENSEIIKIVQDSIPCMETVKVADIESIGSIGNYHQYSVEETLMQEHAITGRNNGSREQSGNIL